MSILNDLPGMTCNWAKLDMGMHRVLSGKVVSGTSLMGMHRVLLFVLGRLRLPGNNKGRPN